MKHVRSGQQVRSVKEKDSLFHPLELMLWHGRAVFYDENVVQSTTLPIVLVLRFLISIDNSPPSSPDRVSHLFLYSVFVALF